MSLKICVFLLFALTANSLANPVESASQTKKDVNGNAVPAVGNVPFAHSTQAQQVFIILFLNFFFFFGTKKNWPEFLSNLIAS